MYVCVHVFYVGVCVCGEGGRIGENTYIGNLRQSTCFTCRM